MPPRKSVKRNPRKPARPARDISWLSFNARVLQEAADTTVPLRERIQFLAIFSNNLDEFFRVRVAALRRMIKYGRSANMHLEVSPEHILEKIQSTVLEQQREFDAIWKGILREMAEKGIHLRTERQLDRSQREFVRGFFDEHVRPNVIPLMVESIPEFPYLREKSLYLAVQMSRSEGRKGVRYALIEVPTRVLNRFVLLPSEKKGGHQIILLEDVIRFNLPKIFSFFDFDRFSSHVVKVTKDAEFDIDYDEPSNYMDKLKKAVRDRRKGKPVRFIYDRGIDPKFLRYLTGRMGLLKHDHVMPGGRIHNFRQFMEFPRDIFHETAGPRKPITHPAFRNAGRVTDVVLRRDVMLHLPYHAFDPLIDLMREAAMDPDVKSIWVTAYRLARNSRVINALVNASRNGKKVTVVIELRARFDEENNLEWKTRLEEEGVRVLLGVPGMKVHAKLGLIEKRVGKRNVLYGFAGTGNLNEDTARIYGDHHLLTSDPGIMSDVARVFRYLERPRTRIGEIKKCTSLLVSPLGMRKGFLAMIDQEIREAKAGRPATITLKLNSLSDDMLISKLEQAAMAGVQVRMVVRGICRMLTEDPAYPVQPYAVSIIDRYLEHARVAVFHAAGRNRVWISSSDWMVRNLDHRIEVALEVRDPEIARELRDILDIQLRDNVKARRLDTALTNSYVRTEGRKCRSQSETHLYLSRKTQSANPMGGEEEKPSPKPAPSKRKKPKKKGGGEKMKG
jgi:polyphosphate kinase